MGGAVAAIDYMKETLIAANAARVEAIEKGEQVLVGVNAYTETEPSPPRGGRRRHHHRA
jgi:(2R)-ethylmalonyl-CoA mutase